MVRPLEQFDCVIAATAIMSDMHAACMALPSPVMCVSEQALLLPACYTSVSEQHQSSALNEHGCIGCTALLCRVEQVETAARRRVLTQKVVARCKQLELTAAWNSWQDVVGGWTVAARTCMQRLSAALSCCSHVACCEQWLPCLTTIISASHWCCWQTCSLAG
jgi:hypothetical protein